MNSPSNLKVPVAEWCSLRQAVQWLAYGTEPRNSAYEEAFDVPRVIDPR